MDLEDGTLARLGPSRLVSALIGLTRSYVRLREAGRVGLLRGADSARHAARALGDQLVASGSLPDPADVFYLTWSELGEHRPETWPDLVASRREAHARYLALELPDRWTGTVEPLAATDARSGLTVSGIGVSPGVVDGRARVVVDLETSDAVQPGEILVCRTTDPSWVPYFLVAAGVVIDIGGPLSHGAVVAREMGIPCVINTRNGTNRLRTGNLLRIDGTRGTVDVLAP